MGSRKSVIRVGDFVRIIKPEFVNRIGYPLSFNEAKDKVVELFGNKIEEFMWSLFPPLPFEKWKRQAARNWRDMRAGRMIVAGIAWQYVKENKFGGNEKKIYTITDSLYGPEDLYKVERKVVVKTGFYSPGYYNYSGYGGEPEIEPAYLNKEKTHILLDLNLSPAGDICKMETCDISFRYHKYYGFIEACNVEKM